MNRSYNIEQIGALGEKLVHDLFKSLGLEVFFSEDKYDRHKDMLIEGETTEVKTLVPIYKSGAFCLGKSQWNKVDEVSRLIFVEIPKTPDSPVYVRECVDKTKFFIEKNFNGDSEVRMYPLTSMRIIGKINDVSIGNKLHSLSPSKYKRAS